VLRACRRILRPGGHTAFFTIHPATGLTTAQRRRASRDGPIAVATARPHRQLLEAAGFTQVTETDCTAEFAATTRAWLHHWDTNRGELAALLGERGVAERQAERRAQLRAIEDGILARSLFTARRPEELPSIAHRGPMACGGRA
jgi:cyclopropane fatty-acyl-phospholipid synthase-like methyltransferase